MIDYPKPTTEQLALIERFRVAFNAIEAHLRYELQEPDETSFTSLVHAYAVRNPVWGKREGRQLRVYATLRNALVHTRNRQEQYLSVPLPSVVENIEQIQDRLLRKERVFPKYAREVESLQINDSLSSVLGKIANHDYSQFPVYDEDGFRGLLTENGITRWLAHYTVREMTLVEFEDEEVATILSEEEERHNYTSVSRQTTVEDAVGKFGRNPFLEAILITETGKTSEALLGLITRWDILEIR